MTACRRTTLLGLLPFLLAAGARAQVGHGGVDSLSAGSDSLQRHNTAGISFERNLNTFNWLGRAFLDTSVGGSHLLFREAYQSNIVIVEASGGLPRRRQQSNQQNAALTLGHPLAGPLGALVEWSSLVYSDDRGVGLSNASNHQLLGGVRYEPAPFLALTPLAGYRWDNQPGFHSRGLSLDLNALLHPTDLDGYLVNGEAEFHQDRLNPRELDNHFARGVLQKSFSPWTRDSLAFGISRSRSDLFALADSNIESRSENGFSLANLLAYTLVDDLELSLFTAMSGRGIDKNYLQYGPVPLAPSQYNTHIAEVYQDVSLQASYRSPDGQTAGWLQMAHRERTEQHTATQVPASLPDANKQEQSKDNISRRTSLAGSIAFPLSLSDRVFLAGAASILRYDTPSLLNDEDRDEQLIAFTLGTSHQVSRFLDISVTLDGTISHLVYLLGDRSNNNSINRVLQLTPRATYRITPWLVSTNAFEVLANYTVYDFPQQNGQPQGFSYREVAWMDSSSVELSSTLGLDFLGYLKLNERGQLNWDEFTERLETSYAERTFTLQARYSPRPATMFAVGFKYFAQNRFGYGVAGKHLESFLRSIGPTCAVLWEIGPHSRFGLRGWYERRKSPDGSVSTLVSMLMNIALTF